MEQVAFKGVGDSNQRGIYRTTPSGLARVADTDHVDSRLEWRVPRFQESQLRRLTGRVRGVGSGAFGQLTDSRRVSACIPASAGTLQAVADRNTTVPGGTGQMRTFTQIIQPTTAIWHLSTAARTSRIPSPPGLTANCRCWSTTKPPFPIVAGSLSSVFGAVALSERNIVLGGADFSTDRRGIYALFDGALFTVIEGGDLLGRQSPRGV
jgi:hypothetical protein